MPTVRYTADGGRYRVAGQTFEPGEEQEVSDALAEHLVDDVGEFERVHENVTDVEFEEVDKGDGAGGQEGKPPDGTGEEYVNPVDLTVDELRDAVEDIDDVASLEAMRDIETEVDDRTTAVDVIDSRLEELEE